MRRQRQDGMCVREVEANALSRQPIDRWRGGRAAIRPERVCAQRVNGDEENVLPRYGVQIDLVRRTSQPEHADGDGERGDSDKDATGFHGLMAKWLYG